MAGARMNPMIIRRKLTEVEMEIARLQREKADPRVIYIEQRKQMVLKKWLEEAEEVTR